MKKKYWYFQDGGTYPQQTPVFVGYSAKEITRILEKKKVKKEILDKWKEEADDMDEYFKGKAGMVWNHDGNTMLLLPSWTGSWEDIETLIHECFHLVMAGLGDARKFINGDSIEEEGMAYQQEYLFRSIRQKLEKEMLTEKK